MMECDQINLNAYHDGELPAEERSRVEAHLHSCEACNTELAAIADASRLLREAKFDDLTPRELENLHETIDGLDDFRVWRIGGTLGLIAASFLIIGMAWLNAMPTSGTNPGGQVVAVSRPVESWERTAVTLRVSPALPSADDQKYDPNFADRMVDGLAMGK